MTVTNFRTDGTLLNILANPATGMGTLHDASTFTDIALPGILSEVEVRVLYQYWFFKRVINTLPRDMTKAGITLNITDGNTGDVAKLEKKLQQLKLLSALREASQWARLFGGAVIFIAANGNNNIDKPLNIDNIRSIDYLRVLDRYQIKPALDGVNQLDPEYYQLILNRSQEKELVDTKGNPIRYRQLIHKSRLIRFFGAEIPPSDRSLNEGWGHSVLQEMYVPFKRHYEGSEVLGQILRTLSTLNIGMSNLGELIAAGHEEKLKSHYKEVAMMVSVYNTLLTDTSIESASYIGRSLSGAPEVINTFREEMTAASGYPHYKIWGTVDKAGLADSGGAESEAYANQVVEQQNSVFGEVLEQFLPLVMQCKDVLGRVPDDWEFSFNSIYKPTKQEQLEEQKMEADTCKVYFDMNAATSEEVRKSLATSQPLANAIELDEGRGQKAEGRSEEKTDAVELLQIQGELVSDQDWNNLATVGEQDVLGVINEVLENIPIK